MTDKQPVLGFEFAGSDTLLGEVVIDAGLWMIDKGGQLGPLGQGVVDGFTQAGVGTDNLTIFL